ncbi:hypothetical protein N0V88_003441 [Collariella sp. IMI 366227]|nr:hypothetical protein N0V88_003441 [Collariella sp. IMI 366227]
MPSMLSSGPAGTGVTSPSSVGHSAPVIEFICLFTHDLKRKQKRWEDGRLKYHTFNKRVMVYDERGNFVGDMHWQREWDFDEGEEVRLERGGVIVQVVECIGRQEQDLTELLDKRAKEKGERQARIAITFKLVTGIYTTFSAPRQATMAVLLYPPSRRLSFDNKSPRWLSTAPIHVLRSGGNAT